MTEVSPTVLTQVALPSGERVPTLGQGTWHMGEDRRRAAAEAVVSEAAQGCRDALFIVTKVLPSNASSAGTVAACERSLKRLGTDRIDLYLLHWRGSVPLAETLEGFVRLARDGKIRHHGVSNFDRRGIEEWRPWPSGV